MKEIFSSELKTIHSMKLYLLLPLCYFLLTSNINAQNTFMQEGKLNGIFPVDASGKVIFQSIKTVDGASKDELFKRARKWFVKTYNSDSQVLQINDQASGELTGKGYLHVSDTYFGATHTYPIRHLLTVEVKENKYRLTLGDLVIDDRGGSFPVEQVPRMGQKWVTKFYTKINSEATALVTSLETALNTADDF